MAEKKGKEEYHLPEDEHFESPYEEEEHMEQPVRRAFSVKELLLNKKVWVPALIVFSVYGVYKFMEYRDKAQMQVNQIETPAKTPAAPLQPATSDSTVIKSELQAAVEQANKNQTQLDSVSGQLNQVQQVQTQMNNELTELNTAVKALTEKLGKEEIKPIVVEKKTVKRIKKHYRPAVIVPAPSYHVRAVIPGRAWLESSCGRLFTVRVGERVIGYGIVKEIDVERGVVITSSGREITYGKYDS